MGLENAGDLVGLITGEIVGRETEGDEVPGD